MYMNQRNTDEFRTQYLLSAVSYLGVLNGLYVALIWGGLKSNILS